ncbi:MULTISPECIES: BtrH N-terminal domain-containing protein [Sphingobacterium]|uniref:BtrH N-terminal domain-containing protein n=1 Tax=Sphingobacterium TaxID=28453 RepID=UPI00096A1549|nr:MULTISPECIES: BtrH N-terminal domain-containing protein [Sphingobacterium]OJZ13921.1 MAG: lantibiotic ABC transporter [Sphingobacterium sp. 40-24]
MENLKPFDGLHCETTATGTLLKHIGIELSEPMLFGLGEGLSFIYWKMKTMDFPFLGGRIKTDLLTQHICKNLGLELNVHETSSKVKAWQAVRQLLDEGQPVGLKLDAYYLEYFTKPFHFAGHYVAIYGYDDEHAYLVDTRQQGGSVKTSLASLALARAEKGPMSSKNLYYTIAGNMENVDLKEVLIAAMVNNAKQYLAPTISNISYKGMLKTSEEVMNWFKTSQAIESEFKMAASLMEKAGTGGALFRNLYRDFIKESYDLLGIEQLAVVHHEFVQIALLWTSLSELFNQIAETASFDAVQQASAIFKTLATKEKNAMEILASL